MYIAVVGGEKHAVRNTRAGRRRRARSRKERSANRLWRWLRTVRGLQGQGWRKQHSSNKAWRENSGWCLELC